MDVLDPNQPFSKKRKNQQRRFCFLLTPKFILFRDTRTQKRAQSQNSLFIINCDPVLLLDVVFSWFPRTTTRSLCSFNTLRPQKCSAVPNFMPALSPALRHRLAAKVCVQQMEVSAPTPRPTCHQSNSLKALNYSICSCSLHRACAL